MHDYNSQEFTRIWTMKESYGKYLGKGICYDMANFTAHDGVLSEGCKLESYLFSDYALSICAHNTLPIEHLQIEDLRMLCEGLEKL